MEYLRQRERDGQRPLHAHRLERVLLALLEVLDERERRVPRDGKLVNRRAPRARARVADARGRAVEQLAVRHALRVVARERAVGEALEQHRVPREHRGQVAHDDEARLELWRRAVAP